MVSFQIWSQEVCEKEEKLKKKKKSQKSINDFSCLINLRVKNNLKKKQQSGILCL